MKTIDVIFKVIIMKITNVLCCSLLLNKKHSYFRISAHKLSSFLFYFKISYYKNKYINN